MSCKNDTKDNNQQTEAISAENQYSAKEKLENLINSEEVPSLDQFEKEYLPLIEELAENKDWAMIEHVTKKAVDAPNEAVFQANYKDLKVLLKKKIN